MKKIILVLSLGFLFTGCSNEKSKEDKTTDKKEETKVETTEGTTNQTIEEKKQTALFIAQTWCEFNGKLHRAATEADKAKAKQDLKDYEANMDAKYKADAELYKMINDAVEACEGASEGR